MAYGNLSDWRQGKNKAKQNTGPRASAMAIA
jgi:hypothetical protein